MNNTTVKASVNENIISNKININFKIEETDKFYTKDKYIWKQYYQRVSYKK